MRCYAVSERAMLAWDALSEWSLNMDKAGQYR